MHTATQLTDECFEILDGGQRATVDSLIDWRRGDRFGVVVDEPLSAVSRFAITHLAVPDGSGFDHDHRMPQWGPVLRRLRRAFVYSPGGRVSDANLVIDSKDARTEENVWTTLHPMEAVAQATAEFGGDREFEVYAALARRRADEVSDHERRLIGQRRHARDVDGRISETYRTVVPEQALSLLNTAADCSGKRLADPAQSRSAS